jgi:hypothetical protein
MKHLKKIVLVRNGLIIWIVVIVLNACGRNSSPEGRMSIKIEDLHKEMIDSMRQQNRAMRDSLSKIREDLQELQQLRK